MNREERFQIEINASPAEVWERLTTSEGLASWFGTRAEIDLRIEGERVVGWGDGAEMSGRITDIDPPHRLRMVYTTEGEGTGAEEWLITSDGTTTRLTLINSFSDDDIDDWEEFFGDIRRGWRLFLASLRHGLEHANSSTRQVDCRYWPAEGPRDSIWQQVESILAAEFATTEGMTPTLIDRPHSRLLTSPDRSLLIDIEGTGEHQVLYVQVATHEGPEQWRRDVLDLIGDGLSVQRANETA